MLDSELKRLITRLTGVPLVREGMADVSNVPPIAERNMQWQEYRPGQAANMPKAMNGELDRLFSSFASKFAQSGGMESQGEQLVYAFYAADPILNDQQRQAVASNPQFIELMDFMENHGLRLWNSPGAEHQWAAENRKPYNPLHVNGGIGPDGRDKYFENFGYAWGARKVAKNRNKRVAQYIAPERAQAILNQERGVDAATQEQRLVQIVTAPRNNAYGIFFQDTSGKLYSVIGDNYYAHGKITQDDQGFADPGLFAATKGQHKKFFGYHDEAAPRGIAAAMPTQTQFFLPDGPDDPNPVPARRGSLADSQRLDRYYLWIRHDGTLWWLNASERGTHLSGGETQMHPLTQEQVDFFNIHKNEYWLLTNPDVEVYDWSTVPEDARAEEQNDYRVKTNLMNQMVDSLSQQGMPPKVHLNAFKYAIIGPSGQSGENVEQQKTVGTDQFLYPTTVDKAPGHDQGYQTITRRRDWVRMSNEFNEQRASKTGAKGYIPQNMSGKGAQEAETTLREALVSAFKQWNINAPFPDEQRINAAQMLFDKVHYPQLVEQDQGQVDMGEGAPAAPADMQGELMGDQGASVQQPTAPAAPAGQPQQPAQPQPQQPAKVKVWDGSRSLAHNRQSLIKNSSDILKQLRKLN